MLSFVGFDFCKKQNGEPKITSFYYQFESAVWPHVSRKINLPRQKYFETIRNGGNGVRWTINLN